MIFNKIYECDCADDKRGWYSVTDESWYSYWYNKDWFVVVKESDAGLCYSSGPRGSGRFAAVPNRCLNGI